MGKCEKKTCYVGFRRVNRRVFPYLGTKPKVSGVIKRIILTLLPQAHYF